MAKRRTDELRKRMAEGLARKRAKRRYKPHPARYDDVYFEGVEAMDRLDELEGRFDLTEDEVLELVARRRAGR